MGRCAAVRSAASGPGSGRWMVVPLWDPAGHSHLFFYNAVRAELMGDGDYYKRPMASSIILCMSHRGV